MANLNPPSFKLTIGGLDFSSPALNSRVHEIEVEQVVDGPWSFKCVLDDREDEFSSGQWKIREEDSIVVQLGYQTEGYTKVFEGEVSGLQSDRRPEERKKLVVRGFCPLQRLSRGRKRRTWQYPITDNDIASQIAGEHGMSAQCGRVNIKYPYVLQNNVTDLAFLFERARRIGYMVNAKGRTLNFAEPELTVQCELVWDASNVTAGKRQLKDFKAESATPGQLKDVSVRFWDPAKKEKILANTSEVHGQNMGGQHTGGEFTGASNQYSEQPVRSIEEAEQVAKSMLNQRAQGFMSGTGQCEGDGRVEAGKLVKIDAIGVEMDGEYYVNRAVHKLKAGAGSGFGYETNFEVMRTGR